MQCFDNIKILNCIVNTTIWLELESLSQRYQVTSTLSTDYFVEHAPQLRLEVISRTDGLYVFKNMTWLKLNWSNVGGVYRQQLGSNLSFWPKFLHFLYLFPIRLFAITINNLLFHQWLHWIVSDCYLSRYFAQFYFLHLFMVIYWKVLFFRG